LFIQYCEPLLSADVDTIVLGCTHYPFVKELIQEIVGDNITLIETGNAVAKHLKNRLQEKNILTDSSDLANVTFWTNSSDNNAEAVIETLWGSKADVYRRP
jgi:glutamate racemase